MSVFFVFCFLFFVFVFIRLFFVFVLFLVFCFLFLVFCFLFFVFCFLFFVFCFLFFVFFNSIFSNLFFFLFRFLGRLFCFVRLSWEQEIWMPIVAANLFAIRFATEEEGKFSLEVGKKREEDEGQRRNAFLC